MLGLAALLGTVAAGPALAKDRGAHKDDSRICASFGAGYGSRDYSECMLAQQRRRDNAPLIAAEQQRLSAEAARNNLETVRRMRCEREAKRERERGERPRWCGR
ncbi:hypothetical protein [Sphingopyxis panaciterrae]